MNLWCHSLKNLCRGCKNKDKTWMPPMVGPDRHKEPLDYCLFWQRLIVRGTLEACDVKERYPYKQRKRVEETV